MELIPGLPDDIGLECLIRIPYKNFSTVASVCKRWKLEIKLPEFWRHRRASGLTRKLIVMAQSQIDPTKKLGLTKFSATPVYKLSVCEMETGYWSDLPPVPDNPHGLPMFCQLVGVGLNLVMLGGWNPTTWEVSKAVYVYNFVSATWRCGAKMPGCPRSFFACASDSGSTVFVAGGHDEEKNALKTAMAYDVAKDEWVLLPDMSRERDECKGVFRGGMFHVIGGYQTNMQGRFSTTAEVFDVSTRQWDPVQEDFLGVATCPRTCVDGDGKLYICHGCNVMAFENPTWKVVAELPSEVKKMTCMIGWQGKLFVIGSPGFSEPYRAYVLNLKSYTWTKVEAPEAFSGHVQSGCCLEI